MRAKNRKISTVKEAYVRSGFEPNAEKRYQIMTENHAHLIVKNIRSVRKLAYSIPELAKYTSLCRNGVYDALNSGELIGRKFGNRTIVLRSEAMRWLKSLPKYQPENLNQGSDTFKATPQKPSQAIANI